MNELKKKTRIIKNKIVKNVPTYFPDGFMLGKSKDGIILINFIENEKSETESIDKVIASFAIPNQRAKELAKIITELVEKVENEK